MRQQILLIHGGSAFKTYDEYLSYLKTKDLTLERLIKNDWKRNLQNYLGEKYLVISPQMPNSQNARYFEWKIWFERIITILENEVILIGHSLGGIFLAKYLSENIFPKNISATFLIAAPYEAGSSESLVDFELTENLKGFNKQGGKIFLYQSRDDVVVSFSDVEKYKKELPDAILRIFENRQHFNQVEFAELVEDIHRLTTPTH